MEWTREALTSLILETARELLSGAGELTPSCNLLDAGLDSLAVTQLMLTIEENTGLWVDESKLTPETLASCEALARCVHAEIAAA